MDSGAKLSLVSVKDYVTHFEGKVDLLTPDVLPFSYGGKPIELKGYFKAKIGFKASEIVGKIYVPVVGDTILSWPHQKELGIILNPNAVPQVLVQEVSDLERQLWSEYPEVFSSNVGCVKDYKHQIVLKKDALPVASKVRNVPMSIRGKVKQELERLKDSGIIEEVEAAQWIAPIVVVTKPSGDIRLCIDLRNLNKEVVEDRFPLPNINEMISTLGDAKVFSTLDLTSAYHQVQLTEDSKLLTSFITPFGVFKFNRMPFGLCSAAAVFQRLMQRLLGGLKGVCFFQDDVLVFTNTQEEHVKKLRSVLSLFKAKGITLKKEKCKFVQSQITYLGHVISGEGVKPKNDLVHTIIRLSTPSCKKDIQVFLGMAEFYARYIPNFAKRSNTIRSLLRKGSEFVWSKECEMEFQDLKEALNSAQFLTSFQPGIPCYLITDASDKGLGCVLKQLRNGVETTVAFASRSLHGAEFNYSTIEKEALAIYWAVKKFRQFLWGISFEVRSDHKPLQEIFRKKGSDNVSSRICKWIVGLQDYQFTVKYVLGCDNRTADCLSRLVVDDVSDECDSMSWWTEDEIQVCALTDGCVSEIEWREELTKDENLSKVMQLLLSKELKDCRDISLSSYKKVWNELWLHEGLLLRGNRLVPPSSLRDQLLALSHSGHPGISKTKERMRALYWWPGMDIALERRVRDCYECCLADKSLKVKTQPLILKEIPNEVWEEVAIDIMGPVSSKSSSKYIIVLMDMLSRWPEVCITSEISSKVVVDFLSKVFSREGNPAAILSDNGVQFISKFMRDFLSSRGIVHKKCALCHPETNGMVERFNRTLKETVQLAKVNGVDWESWVETKVEEYRFTPHSSTGQTPFLLFKKRVPHTKIDPPWLKKHLSYALDSEVIKSNAKNKDERHQLRRKEIYDIRKSMQEKTDKVAATSAQLGLNIHRGKTKILKANTASTTAITLEDDALEKVEAFTYLGSVIDKQGSTDSEIKAQISKAKAVFIQL
ncbi:retrotransposon-like protein 1 [Pleurodeles waltl]|uniref:retrotransposon-like protein 1 n=1 Tax=Pleurodeles waltl TaxID=8319 RepID=UPI00370940F3